MKRFAESSFRPIEVDGRMVHPMFRTGLAVGEIVRVSWISTASPRAQGLTRKGELAPPDGRATHGAFRNEEPLARSAKVVAEAHDSILIGVVACIDHAHARPLVLRRTSSRRVLGARLLEWHRVIL